MKEKGIQEKDSMKHALADTLLSIFPQLIPITVSVPFLPHAGNYSSCSKSSALQIVTSFHKSDFCVPLQICSLDLSLRLTVSLTTSSADPCLPRISDEVFPCFFCPGKNYEVFSPVLSYFASSSSFSYNASQFSQPIPVPLHQQS